MNWIIFLYIYLGVSLATVLLFLVVGRKSEYPIWEKLIIAIFAPFLLVFGLLYIFWLFIDHVRKNGFHHLIPHRKGKAYPLSNEDFRYWGKDYILDGEDDKIRIGDFNKKYNKNLTLDDVYGEGYIDSLTPEDVYQCKTYFQGKYGVQPNMPDTPYAQTAVAFGKCFASSDFSELLKILDDSTTLIRFKHEEINSKERIIDYFSDWVKRAKADGIEVQYIVKWGVNPCRPSLFIYPNGYSNMVLFFRLEDGRVKNIFFGPQHIQDFGMNFNDLNEPTASVESMGRYIEDDSETLSNHLFCPTCGTDSALLDWYNFHAPLGIHGYTGKFSICPDCKKVVEVQPKIRVRYEESQTLAFPHTAPKMASVFKPFIKGTISFETTDENMDCYANYGRPEVLNEKLRLYREENNLEKGNDAAITFSNGNRTEEAISLFTELSEKGCHNSMINLFTVLWSNNGDYKKATDWLRYVEGMEDPSLWCLWNLAVMYYMGEDLKNNPLQKDTDKAKSILKRIVKNKTHSLYKGENGLFEDAAKFLGSLNDINLFSANGKDIHAIITESIVKTTKLKDKGEFFNYARSLSLKDGYKLGLYLASDETGDIGDESYFFIYNDKGEERPIYKSRLNYKEFELSLINVDNSAMGAWQLYLLITSPTIMPVFWHGGYICRTFIFSIDDLKGISPISDRDFSILDIDGLLLPSVEMSSDKRYADVYCCYWNDWKGLVREHIRVSFNEDGTANASEPDEFVFFPYDCGINY